VDDKKSLIIDVDIHTKIKPYPRGNSVGTPKTFTTEMTHFHVKRANSYPRQ